MKRTLLIVILALFGFNQINAQLSLGASGGLNFSNVKLEIKNEGFDALDIKCVQNYFFGIIPKYNFNPKLSVSTDIQYSLKGYMMDGSFNDTQFKHVYIDLIPKAEYQILKWLALGLGLNIGFLVDEKIKYGDDDWHSTKDFGTIKSSDFGIVGSVRGSFKNFFIIVSYDYGLTNIVDISYTDANGQPLDVRQYNRNLQIGLGYFFEFKKE